MSGHNVSIPESWRELDWDSLPNSLNPNHLYIFKEEGSQSPDADTFQQRFGHSDPILDFSADRINKVAFLRTPSPEEIWLSLTLENTGKRKLSNLSHNIRCGVWLPK